MLVDIVGIHSGPVETSRDSLVPSPLLVFYVTRSMTVII